MIYENAVILSAAKNLRKEVRSMNYIIDFIKEEDAISVVEIILIVVVLISLVVIFKNQLVSLVRSILAKITSQSEAI